MISYLVMGLLLAALANVLLGWDYSGRQPARVVDRVLGVLNFATAGACLVTAIHVYLR